MKKNKVLKPKVSVVIPTMSRMKKLDRLIKSIYENNYPLQRIEIIVIDNNSSDDTAVVVPKKFPDIKFIKSKKNLFSAGGRNLGWKESSGDYIFFIDDDNVLDKNCILFLVEAMEKDKMVGISSPLILDYNKKNIVWSAGGILSGWGKVSYRYGDRCIEEIKIPNFIYDIDFFPNSYMIRKELYNSGVIHDNKNFPHNWNEPDFCNQVKKLGLKMCSVTRSVTWHDPGYSGKLTRVNSINVFDQAKSRILYRKKYENKILRKIYFFIFYFPITSFLYLFKFCLQEEKRWVFIVSHMKGYWAGIIQKI